MFISWFSSFGYLSLYHTKNFILILFNIFIYIFSADHYKCKYKSCTEKHHCTKHLFKSISFTLKHFIIQKTALMTHWQWKWPTCKWCMRCFDKCHNLLCLVLFGRRACEKRDEKIYVISSDRLELRISTPVGISYQPNLFSLVFTRCCLFLTVEDAAGVLILQFSQICLIKCVDLLILHNRITLLCHDIVLKCVLCLYSIGDRK